MNRTEKYNDELLKIEHYSTHPQMIPFVGKYWGDYCKKLLVLGESHYLPLSSSLEMIKNWYKTPYKSLSQEEQNWTTTARIIDDEGYPYEEGGKIYPEKPHGIYKNIETAIRSISSNDLQVEENMLRYIAFMNFFQRPSQKTGDSIDCDLEDRQKANDTLKSVIAIIKPDYIFFVSSKSWDYYDKQSFPKNKTGHSCHPTCHWWNRESYKYTRFGDSPVTGRESFLQFLSTNEIMK